MSLRARAIRIPLALAALVALLLGVAGTLIASQIATAASAGSLAWAVDSDFRAYVTGPGGGTVSATGAASDAGGVTTFPATASTVDATGAGTASYGGGVAFSAHGGALAITLTDPAVRFTGPTSAVIVVTSGGSRVDFASVNLSSASVSASGGVVTFSGATTSLTAAGAVVFGGTYPEGRALAPVTFSFAAAAAPDPEPTPTPTPDPTPGVPTVTIDRTSGLNGDGDTITVTGSGFLPDAPSTNGTRPPLAGSFAGTYVVFGKVADTWKPSQGAPSSSRIVESRYWAVPAASVATIGGTAAGAITLEADGTFTTTLHVSDALAASPGTWGVFTYPGSGAIYAPFETFTPITFAPATPTVTVDRTSGLNGDGDTITVTGSGFLPDAGGATTGTRPPLAGAFTGTYVVFGKVADTWKPSQGAPSSSRIRETVKWAVPAASVATVGGSAAGAITLEADGTFTTTLAVSDALAASPGTWGVFTYAGGGSTYAPFETFTPITFAAVVPDPEPTPEPTTPPTPPAPTTVGRLTWGVDGDFRSYITGPIAQGSISVSGASSNGSSFTFIQSGGTADTAAGSGSASYAGSVTFTGHAGALDLVFSSPTVRLTSTSSAVLSLAVNGSRVDFATLDLGAGTRTTSGDAVRFAGVPATLTSAGSTAFQGFYPAGRALDPVTVTFGVGTTATGTGTRVVASAPVAPTSAIPATPPATTGIELEADALASLVAGEQTTITVGGFAPGETGITVVLYSTPTVLASNLTADANGVVTWTGTLPAGLSGTHTLTFQGSVSKGIVIEIPALAVGSCTIEDATLTWGVKEAFRAYIESTIANGGWELAGDVTDVDGGYAWAAGTGAIEPDASAGTVSFTGSVRFTGHEGVLDTTVANPRITFSGDAATLVVDVTGTTQGGAAVDQQAVPFATLDLTAATITEAAGVVTLAGVPATLTAEGAAAFGTYPEGEALDAVTVALEGADGCALPLAGVAAAEPSASPSAAPLDAAPAETADDSDGVAWWVWAIIAVAVAGAAAAVVVWRRRP